VVKRRVQRRRYAGRTRPEPVTRKLPKSARPHLSGTSSAQQAVFGVARTAAGLSPPGSPVSTKGSPRRVRTSLVEGIRSSLLVGNNRPTSRMSSFSISAGRSSAASRAAKRWRASSNRRESPMSRAQPSRSQILPARLHSLANSSGLLAMVIGAILGRRLPPPEPASAGPPGSSAWGPGSTTSCRHRR